jgi:hypothetical protein
MVQAVRCDESLFLYLVLCATALLVGLGLVRLCKFKLGTREAMLLAPLLALLFWTLALGMIRPLHLPIRRVAPWLWGGSLVLVLLGWRRLWTGWRTAGPLLVFCASLPVVLMAPYFWNGLSDYMGSVAPDGWAYIAVGQFRYSYPTGTENLLEPLYQFGSAFDPSRDISFNLLAFFSPLVRSGETQGVSALLQAWSLFTMTCTVALYWITLRPKTWVFLVGTGLTTLAGWMANLIWSGTLDNGLALAYFPAFASVFNLLDPRRRRWWLLLGGLCAGIFYTYPELALFILAGAALMVLGRLCRQWSLWPLWVRGFGIALGLAVIISLPVAKTMLVFVQQQLKMSPASHERPGEGLFAGVVLGKYQLGAVWGLGSEHQVPELNGARQIVGSLLTALLVVGLAAVARSRHWGLAAATLVLLAATCYCLFGLRYSYAAYKLIVINWWCLLAGVVLGADWLLGKLSHARLRQLAAGLLIGLAAFMLALTWLARPVVATMYARSVNQKLRMGDFRQVTRIQEVVGSRPVLLAIEDWLAAEWAVYFLRTSHTYLGIRPMYFGRSGMVQKLEQAGFPDFAEIGYLLTDDSFDGRFDTPQIARLLWAVGPYRLWKFKQSEWAVITEIHTSTGHHPWGGKSFFWMEEGDTRMEVVVNKAGTLRLEGAVVPCPGIPGWHPRRLLVRTDAGYRAIHLVPKSKLALSVPVRAGRNTLVFHPSGRVPLPGWQRQFEWLPLLGWQGIRLRLTGPGKQ